MPRVCFTLRVKPSALEQYRARHEAVWPEMRRALTRSGWRNYSLFLSGDGLLVGYVETDHSLDEVLAAMAAEPVNDRWQELMAPYFEGDGQHADTMMNQLEEIFHLP